MAEEEKKEEESVKTPETETTEKAPSEGTEPEQKSEEMSEEEKSKLASFDRIYAERKELREKLDKMDNELQSFKEKESFTSEEKEVQKIIEITSALGGLDDEEKKEVMLRAKAGKVSLSEARKNPNFLLWQKAKREQVEKEKLKLEPSTKVSPSDKPIEKITPEDLKNMSFSDREETLKKMGWIRERR